MCEVVVIQGPARRLPASSMSKPRGFTRCNMEPVHADRRRSSIAGDFSSQKIMCSIVLKLVGNVQDARAIVSSAANLRPWRGCRRVSPRESVSRRAREYVAVGVGRRGERLQ